MTTYVYKCPNCGKLIELKFHLGQQPSTVSCPECGENAVRYLGRTGVTSEVHFKGWDWSRKHLLDPASDDPRLDPAYFDDLLEDTDRGPKTFFTTKR